MSRNAGASVNCFLVCYRMHSSFMVPHQYDYSTYTSDLHLDWARAFSQLFPYIFEFVYFALPLFFVR